MADDKAETLKIKTLGGLVIEQNGRPQSNFVSTKAEALLVYLACTRREHPRESLAALLWDDRTQRQAMSNLRTVLYSLRKEVGSFVTITRKTAAVNHNANILIDVLELEAAIPKRGVQSEAGAHELEQALKFYQGDFLAGFFLTEAAEFESWVAAQRERCHRLFVEASLQVGRWHLENQEFSNAVATASQLIHIDPLVEAGHRQLIESLARNGQRAEALAQYEKCRQILEDELGLEPEAETQSLYETIRTDALLTLNLPHDKEPASEPPRSTLPSKATQMLGREKELAELKQLLTKSNLVTIVGPGGMGKTTLALELTHTLADKFEDGAAFVPLASLSSTGAVLPAITKAIQFEFLDQSQESKSNELLNFLRTKRMLLVLDNFEHLLDAAPLIAEIASTAPDVKVLATSRERLKLQVEHVFFLYGLALTQWQTLEEAKEDSAVQLFVQHARRVRPTFSIRPEHVQPLQSIFHLVGGLPLAIIMAANWIEVLSPAEILSEISHNLDLLEATVNDIPDRHQSMRAVFDGTWNRLQEREQQIFAALSVFRGGFTLAAAREVAQATPRDLMKLVDQSLVVRAEGGRFELHELLRQFAEQELGRSKENKTKVRNQFSKYFCTFLQQRQEKLEAPRSVDLENEIAADFENILPAWYWACDHFPELVLLAQKSFGYYINLQADKQIGIEPFLYLESKISKLENVDSRLIAEQLIWAAKFSLETNPKGAEKLLNRAQECLSTAKDKGEDIRVEKAFLLWVMSELEYKDRELWFKYAQESISIYNELGYLRHVANMKQKIGYFYLTGAEYLLAEEYFQESINLSKELNDPVSANQVLFLLATSKAWAGKLTEAEALFRDNLETSKLLKHNAGLSNSLAGLGETLLFSGLFKEAIIFLDQDQGKNSKIKIDWYLCDRSLSLLHLGRYSDAIDQIQPILKGDGPILESTPFFLGLALFLKGNRQLAINEAGKANITFQESLSLFTSFGAKEETGWSKAGLIYSLLIQGNTTEARQYLIEILELNLFLSLIQAVPAAALLMAELGNTERAVELHAHALTHPFIANSQWFRDVALDKLDTLAVTLPAETVAAAQERGRSLDLWQTAESLLQELQIQKTEIVSAQSASEILSHSPKQHIIPPSPKLDTTPSPHAFRFIQEELIAVGGFGEVYRGRDTSTDQIVVIKRLKPELVEHQPQLLARFVQEGELLRHLNHPNIVKIIASQEINGRYCLIMEYVPGGTLYNLLNRQIQLPLTQTLDIALELADALSRAHHLDIIHRDLKPANVLLAQDGTPRLTDFGLARFIQQPGTKLTPTGASMGTLTYMSPEAFDGERLDGRTDIWAFGVMLFEMLAGELPFKGRNMAALITAILTQFPSDLMLLRHDVPPELAHLITQILIKDRESRIGRMRQVAAQLDRIRSQLSDT